MTAVREAGTVTVERGAHADSGTTDADLVEALTAGDRAALAALFDRYADRLYNHCFRRTANYHDAEDAVSTVFMTVWRQRGRVRLHEGSAAPWLFGVATNVMRNLERGHRRQARLAGRIGGLADVAVDPADDVADRVDAEVRMRVLLDRIRALPRPDQEVLALVVWSGLSYAETAAALDVPVGTVRSRLSRARARLDQQEAR